MIERALLVGAGGFLGAASRYLAGGLVHRVLPESFPWGTLVVNVSSCALSEDLPVVVEIVDTEDKIQAFLPVLDGMVKEGLATVEKATVIFYRG